MKNALKSSGDLRHDFPDEVIDEIVEWADLNNDGVLNYNEFLRMVTFFSFLFKYFLSYENKAALVILLIRILYIFLSLYNLCCLLVW